jgi:hypothetical protein
VAADSELRRPARRKGGAGVEDNNRRVGLSAQKIALQAEAFAFVEAILAGYGRVCFILHPQGEDTNESRRARAANLRSLLGVADDVCRFRWIRNKWTHFDETIDSLPAADLDGFIPQKFAIRSREESPGNEKVIRLFLMDDLSINYRPFGQASLSQLIAEVDDIGARAEAAIQTWADRHYPHG